MKAANSQECLMYDGRYGVGDLVEVRWTNSHRYHAHPAKVTKMNGSSVRAALLQDVESGFRPGEIGWRAGHEIRVPRPTTFGALQRWSVNNCIAPVGAALEDVRGRVK